LIPEDAYNRRAPNKTMSYTVSMKPTTLLFIIAASVLAVTHYLSLELFLYWRYLWLDMPMHLLGGVVAALGYLSLRDFMPNWQPHWSRSVMVIGFVFLVALSWEVFEFAIGIEFDNDRYLFDTISDLFIGVAGGLIGYFIGTRIQNTL